MWRDFIKKFVKFVDPKLEPYREKKVVPKYTPKTLEDFIGVVQRTPKSVLSAKDRERLAAIMSYDEKTVGDLMVEKSKMVFVKSTELLGPLVLDKLYQSGFTHFPVVNSREKVIGIIHTEALNALEVRSLDKAEKYIDGGVNYLHASDSLKRAVAEIVRTGSMYFLVLDGSENLAGFFTLEMLVKYLAV
ncbi:CBS domain-containing protein [Candidatus Saccharibacteria bacterium]|nr:CBS domain-containing protein [Candidatus Saccharibacteria bacterium]MBQ3294832.1 CBS domain-containing protein [Candidatus Saccharibacteria bacterium]MBQ6320791.1 CBS domain-containing protein [Candidatus Saccharibacteria bacterium]